jgi:hypothetical protein
VTPVGGASAGTEAASKRSFYGLAPERSEALQARAVPSRASQAHAPPLVDALPQKALQARPLNPSAINLKTFAFFFDVRKSRCDGSDRRIAVVTVPALRAKRRVAPQLVSLPSHMNECSPPETSAASQRRACGDFSGRTSRLPDTPPSALAANQIRGPAKRARQAVPLSHDQRTRADK